jgi:hypothetical protein
MLKDIEVRRIISYLSKILEEQELAEIEDILISEDGVEVIREPDFLQFFRTDFLELKIDSVFWRLKIIPYTNLRMIQRGISQETIEKFFTKFIQKVEIISIGAYTIYGKVQDRKITLRLDIDYVSDIKGEGHTVTVFVGSGDTRETISVLIDQ